MNTPFLITYSPSHKLHAPPLQFAGGEAYPNPDQPARVERVLESLKLAQLPSEIQIAKAIPRQEDLLLVHSQSYLNYLQSWHTRVGQHQDTYFNAFVFPIRKHMERLSQSPIGKHGYYCYDTFVLIGSATWEAATGSASCALVGARALLNGNHNVVYALCRPPGHHAGSDFAGGYCYLNNAALAARLLSKSGKVAVLDLDYHHGNGTQEIFWEDEAVWTGSIHGHPHYAYPYYSGYEDEIGSGRGRGLNSNIPLPLGAKNSQYIAALEQQLDRLITFAPDWVVVSLGFDTFVQDNEGKFDLSVDCYSEIGCLLRQLGVPLMVVQEGGYFISALGDLAIRFFSNLII